MARSFDRRFARTALPWGGLADVVSAVLITTAIFVVATGGFTVRPLGYRLAVHDPWRPLLVACAITVVRLIVTRKSLWLAHLLAVGLLVQAVAAHYQPGVGFTDLITFGTRFQDRALLVVQATPHHIGEGPGYDGQFYAQLAVDSWLRDPALADALDNAGYRARRILFSWTAYVLGLGRPWWVLQAYAVQNVLCWLILAWLLTRWFKLRDLRAFALWFGCLFADGLIASVRFALLDGPSLLLIALVVVAAERGRHWAASGLLALAGLGREANLIAGVALLRPRWWKRREALTTMAQGLLAVLPLVLWLAYVRWGAGFKMSLGGFNFAWPFVSYVAKWKVTVSELASEGFSSSARFSLYALVSLTTQAVFLSIRRNRQSPWWRVGAASIVLMAFLGPAVWTGDPGAVTRAVMPMTVAFNVLLIRERWFWPLFVLGNLTILGGLETLRVPWLSAHL